MGIPYAEVIGDPIAHSKSPLIHSFWLEKLGLDGRYGQVQLRPEQLADYTASRRNDPDWRGCNVTMPLKQRVKDYLDRLTAMAEAVGAINCITPLPNGLVGTNTDIAGVAASIPQAIDKRFVCVIGSGGAGRSALAMFSNIVNCRDVRVLTRNVDRASQSLKSLNANLSYYPIKSARAAFEAATIVVQATPLGMRGSPAMPSDVIEALAWAHPDAFVLEMIYAPLETSFLKRAKELGFGWQDGLTMLLEQAAESFRLFFGASAPREHDAALRQLLAR